MIWHRSQWGADAKGEGNKIRGKIKLESFSYVSRIVTRTFNASRCLLARSTRPPLKCLSSCTHDMFVAVNAIKRRRGCIDQRVELPRVCRLERRDSIQRDQRNSNIVGKNSRPLTAHKKKMHFACMCKRKLRYPRRCLLKLHSPILRASSGASRASSKPYSSPFHKVARRTARALRIIQQNSETHRFIPSSRKKSENTAADRAEDKLPPVRLHVSFNEEGARN